MSFKVRLYTIEKYDRSTKQPTGTGKEYECLANTPFSILSPTLRLATGDAVSVYNYVYVPSVDRYYFVNEWTYSRGLWEADCAVDVLASWKSYIGDSTLYVLRSAAQSDGAVIDMAYPTTAKLDVVQKAFTLAGSDQEPWNYDGVNGSYVVGIAGRTGGAVTYWAMNNAMWSNFTNEIFGSGEYAGIVDEAEKRNFNPLQYFVSAKWFPFNIQTAGGTAPITLGWWTMGSKAFQFEASSSRPMFSGTITIPKHPQAGARGKYMNSGAFSAYALKLPCFGLVQIPPALIIDSTSLEVEIWTNIADGTGMLKVTANNRTEPIIFLEAPVGCPVQLSQVSAGLLSSIANRAQAGGGLLGEVVQAARSAITEIGEVVGLPVENSTAVATSGTNASRAMTKITPALLATFTYATDEDVQHRGRPLCKLVKVSTLSGYIQAADGDILAPATESELRSIKAYLEGGFFYE